MNTDTLVIALVGVILGGGLTGALIPVFRFKADKGSVIAVGAESAVASLTAALKRSDQRVTNLEAENQMLLVTIEEMKIKIEGAQESVRVLTRDLDRTKARLDQILKEK
jgi:chromosome segregation ATPase